jgi:uncharacterized protein GlcG (DUF336 family)
LLSTWNYIRLFGITAGAIMIEATKGHIYGAAQYEGRQASGKDKMMLTLLKARKIVNQALVRARELNVSVSVAVCDTSGRLIALNQMDGSAGWEEDRRSMGKAVAAAITGLPSDRLVEELGKGGPRLSSYDNVVPPQGQRGGLPVVEAGIVQGGCGVSGAPTAEEDEDCARAGIAAQSPKGRAFSHRLDARFSRSISINAVRSSFEGLGIVSAQASPERAPRSPKKGQAYPPRNVGIPNRWRKGDRNRFADSC